MHHHWQSFAQTDAAYYIDTSSQGLADFWARGERNVATYMEPLFQKYELKRNQAIDIGCGIGRHTRPLKQRFAHVLGVDVAQEMIDQATQYDRSIVYVQNETFLAQPESFQADFVLCFAVFQHIESEREIQKLLRAAARSLAQDGIALVQFDTRPSSLMDRAKQQLPDTLLPKNHKRGIRRIRRCAEDVRTWLQVAGLVIAEEQQPNSTHHMFIATRAR